MDFLLCGVGNSCWRKEGSPVAQGGQEEEPQMPGQQASWIAMLDYDLSNPF